MLFHGLGLAVTLGFASHASHQAVSDSIRKTWDLATDEHGGKLHTNRIPALADFSNLEGADALPATFAAGFSDYSVLQRAPATASIYGLPGSPFTLPATAVAITIFKADVVTTAAAVAASSRASQAGHVEADNGA